MTNTTTALEIAETISLILSASLETAADEFDAYRVARQDVTEWVNVTYPTAKMSSGAYRTAAIFDDFVVKFSKDYYRQPAIVEEAEFIQSMQKSPKYSRHFPTTHVVQVGMAPVLVQQKVDMKKPRGITWDDTYQVERLAEHLGITDMHDENYGWAGKKGKEYPVFIDVDLRNGRGAPIGSKARSWFV
jgi:hypothetical protein